MRHCRTRAATVTAPRTAHNAPPAAVTRSSGGVWRPLSESARQVSAKDKKQQTKGDLDPAEPRADRPPESGHKPFDSSSRHPPENDPEERPTHGTPHLEKHSSRDPLSFFRIRDHIRELDESDRKVQGRRGIHSHIEQVQLPLTLWRWRHDDFDFGPRGQLFEGRQKRRASVNGSPKLQAQAGPIRPENQNADQELGDWEEPSKSEAAQPGVHGGRSVHPSGAPGLKPCLDWRLTPA